MGGNRIHRSLRGRIGAVCVILAASFGGSVTSAYADEVDWMFNQDAVVEIDLGGLSESEIQMLEEEPDDYVKGSFALKVEGVQQGPAFSEVGIRLKGGFGSFEKLTKKAGFKVKFDEYVKGLRFFGLERLTLNNMVQDPSMLHEGLTYELFEAMDLPGSRTGYAFVRLNDLVYGVYLNIETLDEHWLPKHFASTQHLYEADESQVDVVPGGAGKFEVDQGDDEDLSDLEALIAAASDADGDWSDGMAAVADLEQMARQWAVERYVSHWDGYAGEKGTFRPNNYYLHSDDAGIFTMLPWGADQTWGSATVDNRLAFGEEAGGVLFNYCYADASCKALYDEALVDVYEIVTGGEIDFDRKAVERAALLEPCQALEETSRRKHGAQAIAEGVLEAREYIEERPEELADYLGLPFDEVEEEEPASLGAGCPSPPSVPGGQQGGGQVLGPVRPVAGFGKSRVRGNVVSTRLTVLGAGVATQRVTTRLNGRRVLACKGEKSRATTGRLTVRCRLTERVRKALESSRRRLRIRVGFVPQSGAPQFDVRRLSVPRRP